MSEFNFHTKLDQTILLGRRAKNVRLLLEGIREVPGSSIYYHTHRFLQQHHFLSPEPPNDFAYWVSNVLGDDTLGEQLSSVDIIQFHSVSELRGIFVGILEKHLSTVQREADAARGEEFQFMASRIFTFPTQQVAHSLREFRDILAHISVNSLYYHIFDSKLRLEQGDNDFSRWFRDLGRVELADEVQRLDPYSHTLDGLRKRIMVLVKKYDTN